MTEPTIHERLRRDFPEHHELIDARHVRGLAEHNGRPFEASLKETWAPDGEEELGDFLFYVEAEIELVGKRKRRSAEAYHRWLTLRACRRTVAGVLSDMKESREPEAPPAERRRRKREAE